MATQKPDLTRVWANLAPGANVVDPDTTTPGKVNAGWQAEIPPFEHFNFIQQWFSQGLAHINEQGIASWDTDTIYPVNALAKGSDGAVYRAIVEQSGNNPTTDGGANWLFIDINASPAIRSTKGYTRGLTNIPDNQPVNMVFGIDSLTDGAGGDSYLYFLKDMLWHYYSDRGGYSSFSLSKANFTGASFGQSGFTYINTLDPTTAPAIYSFDFQGLHTVAFTNADFVNWEPLRAFKSVKLYYLRQPGGAQFRFGYNSVPGTDRLVVDTDGALALQFVKLTYNPFENGILSISHEADGILTLFGVFVEAEDGVNVTMQALGGKKVEDFANLVYLNTWYSQINPDLFVFNGGMNDRNTRTATEILTDYQNTFEANLPSNCDVLMVSPNQSGDYATSSLPELEKLVEDYSRDNNLGYLRVSDFLGTYAEANDNGLMLDGVHPNSTANRLIANKFAEYLNIPSSKGPFIQRQFGEANGFRYTGDLSLQRRIVDRADTELLYTLGLTNGNCSAVFEFDVLAQRDGTGQCVKAKHIIRISNGVILNQATSFSAVTYIEDFRETSGDGFTHNHTITAAIVSNQCRISITSDAGDNAAVTAQRYTVTGKFTFGNLTVQGQSVFEN